MSKISKTLKTSSVNGQQKKKQPVMSTKPQQPAPSSRPVGISLRSNPIGNGKEGSNSYKVSKKGAQINGLAKDGTMKMEKRLQKRSPWYSSLRDPMQGGGARIPDLTGINTATLQSVQVFSVTTNAAGLNAFGIVSPYVCNSGAVVNVFQQAAGSLSTALTWAAAGTGKLACQDPLIAVAQSLRVVSAAIYAEYEGSTLNDTGEVTSFVLPYEPFINSTGIAQNYAAFQANYASSVTPLNKARSRPVVSYWFPISSNTWEYSDFQNTDNIEWSRLPTSGTSAYSPFWSFGHIMTGITGTPTVKYTVVINYEFVPRINTVNYISSSPSPIDPLEEQFVEQWVQTDAQTGITSNKLADVQPGSQKVDEAEQGMTASNMFGMLGSIVKEILPLVGLL